MRAPIAGFGRSLRHSPDLLLDFFQVQSIGENRAILLPDGRPETRPKKAVFCFELSAYQCSQERDICSL